MKRNFRIFFFLPNLIVLGLVNIIVYFIFEIQHVKYGFLVFKDVDVRVKDVLTWKRIYHLSDVTVRSLLVEFGLLSNH